jgi:hypothetical protein
MVDLGGKRQVKRLSTEKRQAISETTGDRKVISLRYDRKVISLRYDRKVISLRYDQSLQIGYKTKEKIDFM